MTDRLDSKGGTRGFEVRNPQGLNAIDVLTIIAVVVMLTMLLRATLAKQGYSVAEPFNWMRATAVQLAHGRSSGGTAVAANAPLPPPSAANPPLPGGAANASVERIRVIPVTNYSWSSERSRNKIAKRSGRGQHLARQRRNADAPSASRSDERIAFVGATSWENPLQQ